jgi:hypothetical protein
MATDPYAFYVQDNHVVALGPNGDIVGARRLPRRLPKNPARRLWRLHNIALRITASARAWRLAHPEDTRHRARMLINDGPADNQP